MIELSHEIPPPLAYLDRCAPTPTLAIRPACSMQAAYDIVRPHGYRLLQYDWPDGVFVYEAYAAAFPCLLPANAAPADVDKEMARHYQVGYQHADRHYTRLARYKARNAEFITQLSDMARDASSSPRAVTKKLINLLGLGQKTRWVEVSVGGTGCGAIVNHSGVTWRCGSEY